MLIKLYQIDAFTDVLYGGNPAAVCALEYWLQDEILQKIAAENNLSETAFFVEEGDAYEIRWFTPTTEVALCGHATLATAYVIFNEIDTTVTKIIFKSLSGMLTVTKKNHEITLDFPLASIERCETNDIINRALHLEPVEIWKGGNEYMAVLETAEQVQACTPNFELIARLDANGLIITARGKTTDFVSRYFCPQLGIKEDPVTGSTHCVLAPYWTKQLNKKSLTAEQLSLRGGKLQCQVNGNRVFITGTAVLYLRGEITKLT